MFPVPVEQRYVPANPFSGVKAKGGGKLSDLEACRAFTEGEWTQIRTIADGLEWSYGWSVPAADRLRFLLDFGFATGLRRGELVRATLKQITANARGEHLLKVLGMGTRSARSLRRLCHGIPSHTIC
jgi:integrase